MRQIENNRVLSIITDSIIPALIIFLAVFITQEISAQNPSPGNNPATQDLKNHKAYSGDESMDDDLCSINAIQRYLARQVRYPGVAVQDGHTGIIELYARINNEGRVNELLTLQPGRDYLEVGEVVVTENVPAGITIEESSRHESLIAESRRVIMSMPQCDIQEIFGQTLKFRFKFELQ